MKSTTITYHPVWVVIALTNERDGVGSPLAVFDSQEASDKYLAKKHAEGITLVYAEEFALRSS